MPHIFARAFSPRPASQNCLFAVFYSSFREGVEMIDTAAGNSCPVAASADSPAKTERDAEKFVPAGLLIPHTTTFAEAELMLVQSRIDRYLGNKTRAAASLGIALKTIYNVLNRART
jgi:DNA-binding NtrC family response regulator